MSIWSTSSKFIQATFTTATSTVQSAEKGIDILNDLVDNQHKKITRVNKASAISATAEALNEIDARLKADPELKAKFDELEADW